MHYKVEYREVGSQIVEAENPTEAQIIFELSHNHEGSRSIIDTIPVAVNGKGEVFNIRERVVVPDDELGDSEWILAAVLDDDMVLCVQRNEFGKLTSEQEVPQSILRKL